MYDALDRSIQTHPPNKFGTTPCSREARKTKRKAAQSPLRISELRITYERSQDEEHF